MAHAPDNVPNPVSVDAFTADRQKMFDGFIGATTFSIVASIVILALMYIFLLA